MINKIATWTKQAILGLAMCLSVAPVAMSQVPTQNTNAVYAPQTFTATSQIGAPIQLGQSGGSGGSYSVGNISVTGSSLTTATFSVYGSSDGGNTYYPLSINAVNAPSTVATTITVTASGIYQVNLSGITQVKFVTSGTFTATSVTFTFTAAPNGIIARATTTSTGGPPTGTASGCLNGTYPGPGLTQTCIAAQTGIVLANSFPGADIGAQITNAIATLPLNFDSVPVGTVTLNGTSGGTSAVYNFSTAVVFPRSVKLECNGAYLVWQGSNSAAVFTWAGPDTNPFAAGGTSDCNLISQDLITDGDPAFVPSIATIAINAAGTGYAVGDIVSVLKSSATLGTAVVTAAPGGVPSSISVLHGGYAYATATGLTTSPVTGSGSGLTVDITVNPVVSCYPYNATPTLPSGIFIGGDPTNRLVPSGDYGSFETFTNTRVAGFCGALLGGNNTWANNYFNVSFDDNYWGIDDELKSQVNAGERSTFHGGKIYDNVGANIRADGGSEFTFDGTNIDYSEQLDGSSRWIGGVEVVGGWMVDDFESVHFEDKYGPIIAQDGTYKGWVSVDQGDIYLSASPAYSTSYFAVAGANGSFHVNSTIFNSGNTVPFWFSNPTNGAYLDLYNPVQGGIGVIPTAITTTGQTQPIQIFAAPQWFSVQPLVFNEIQNSSQVVAKFLQPNVPDGAIVPIEVGVTASTNDCTQMVESYVSSGNASNFGALRMCGSTNNAAQWNATGILVAPNGFKAEGTSTPFTAISTALTTSSISTITDPSLDANQEVYQTFGVDATNYDLTLMGLHFVSAGSTSNYAFLDLDGLGSHAIEILGTGAIIFNYATTATNVTDSALTSGDIVCASTGGLLANCTTVAQTNVANIFAAAQTAPQFYLQSLAAGPYAQFWDDFYAASQIASGNIGSPAGGSVGVSNNHTDINHPGNLTVASGTTTGTGYYATEGGDAEIVTPNSSLPWKWQSTVLATVLPLTTAGAYQVGMVATVAASPWTTGIGFTLSSANSGFVSANNWGCEYGSGNITDSTVLAQTSTFVRLNMANDGAKVHWYINGTEVCGTGVAIASIPSSTMFWWAATSTSTGTNIAQVYDTALFQENVVR